MDNFRVPAWWCCHAPALAPSPTEAIPLNLVVFGQFRLILTIFTHKHAKIKSGGLSWPEKEKN